MNVPWIRLQLLCFGRISVPRYLNVFCHLGQGQSMLHAKNIFWLRASDLNIHQKRTVTYIDPKYTPLHQYSYISYFFLFGRGKEIFRFQIPFENHKPLVIRLRHRPFTKGPPATLVGGRLTSEPLHCPWSRGFFSFDGLGQQN